MDKQNNIDLVYVILQTMGTFLRAYHLDELPNKTAKDDGENIPSVKDISYS